jgi:hypothetical protein
MRLDERDDSSSVLSRTNFEITRRVFEETDLSITVLFHSLNQPTNQSTPVLLLLLLLLLLP